MKLPRRQFLHLAVGAAALPAVSRFAWAQTYPARPVQIIVGYPPGGATDAIARLIAQQLSERLGQQFMVDNRPGPGSNIGTEAVVRSQPDGYTLLLIFSANAINATFYDKLSFNFIRDIAPVASIARSPFVMEVHPSVPAKTVPEFIAYAKANPGTIRMASNGNGTTAHVAGELFKLMTGVEMLHVPYRGPEPALTDLLAGKVQVKFGIPLESIEYIRAGKLPVLAVTTAARSEVLPDIPTVGEFVPGYEASAFFGLGAPKERPLRSSTSSTEKLTRRSPIQGSGRASPRWAVRCLPGRQPNSASSLPTKPRSGARSSGPPTSSRSDPHRHVP